MTALSEYKGSLLRVAVVTLLSVFGLSLVTPVVVFADAATTNHDMTVSGTETKQALQDAPGILGASDQVTVKADADSAVVSRIAGTVVDVPKDPEQGVIFGAEAGTKIEIDLPSAENAGTAKTVANGVVAYDSGNGSANAVQATEDGGVRMLTIIDNPNAPTTYDYRVTVPNGGKIELTEDGGAIVLDGNDQPISTINTPWAKDANEMPIKTWFTTDGQTLTQHVQHNVQGVVYPVTADPWVKRWYGWDIELNRRQTNNVMLGMSGAAAASLGIPDPFISKVVAGSLAVLTGYANWAYNNGGCLKLRVAYNGWTVPGHYYGGNCR